MLDDKTKNKSKSTGPTCTENLSYYFSQYCGATSIHGIQYIGERGRLLVEKIVWICIVTTVLSICLFLISKTYQKWKTSPVIVSFGASETSISEIPFPAVTILPTVNSKDFNYFDVCRKKLYNEKLTDKENEYFESFSLFCDACNSSSVEDGNSTIDLSFIEYLEQVNPYANGSFKVTWQGKDKEMEEMQLIYTYHGVAFSFNMLFYLDLFNNPLENSTKTGKKIKQWSLDEGYPKEHKNSADAYPYRTFMPGAIGGLEIIAEVNASLVENTCNNLLSGYMVILHHPCELPEDANFFVLPMDQIAFVAIKPRMTTVSEKLRSYKPEDRKCYLTDERQLKYFKYYTQINCMHECAVNQTVEKCGCRPFHMFMVDSFPICGRGSVTCAQESFLLNENIEACNCLPSCTSLEYDVEVSQSKLDYMDFLRRQKKLQGKDANDDISEAMSKRFSALVMYYKEMQFLTTERNELYGYVDFFSNIGGLLGLFIGISVTSMLEIVYFLTLRLVCNIKKYGRRFWSGAPELMEGHAT